MEDKHNGTIRDLIFPFQDFFYDIALLLQAYDIEISHVDIVCTQAYSYTYRNHNNDHVTSTWPGYTFLNPQSTYCEQTQKLQRIGNYAKCNDYLSLNQPKLRKY